MHKMKIKALILGSENTTKDGLSISVSKDRAMFKGKCFMEIMQQGTGRFGKICSTDGQCFVAVGKSLK